MPQNAPSTSSLLVFNDLAAGRLSGPDAVPYLDELLTLAQAAGELPRRRGGRKTAVQTLYRWSGPGCRGVRLQFTQVGGTRCTTRRWLGEFFAALALKAGAEHQAETAPNAAPRATGTPAARRKEIEAAERELDELIVRV